MSKDSLSPLADGKDVDVDDLEVEIFIIAKNPAKLKPASVFLSRRGWPTTVLGNVAASIEHIAEKKPDIVLISYNHPSQTIGKVPELIAQTFNLMCVGFVEDADAASMQKLNQAKIRDKIPGQASGPNLYRGVHRILSERLAKSPDKKRAEAAEAGGNANSVVTIKGGSTKDKNSVIRQKGQNGQAQGSSSEAQDSLSGDATEIASSNGGSENEFEATLQESQLGAESELVPKSEEVSNGKYTMGRARKSFKEFTGADRVNEVAGNMLIGRKLKREVDSNEEESSEKGQNKNITNGVAVDQSKEAAPVDLSTDPGVNAKEKQAAANPGDFETSEEPAPSTADLVGMLKHSLFGDGGEDVDEELPQTALEKALKSAFAEICGPAQGGQPFPINAVSRVGVYPVETPAVSGYIVIAMPEEKVESSKEFLASSEDIIRSRVQEAFVGGQVNPGFWVDLNPVSFDFWAEGAAIFNFKLEYQGTELAVAFFQTEKDLPKPKESNGGMFSIDIDEISTEQPVNFKGYLHLRSNNRYFLYLRNGRRLQPEQKERLLSKKVGGIYMKGVDLKNLQMFLASCFLNETIKNLNVA